MYYGDNSCEGRGQGGGGGGEPRLGNDHIYVPQETQHSGTPAQGCSGHPTTSLLLFILRASIN